jgi:TRAP-type C4-dicarboxylate transport system substrate-binding protein
MNMSSPFLEQSVLEGMSPEDQHALEEAAAGVEILIDERIDRQLTPEVLSKLAFKGITPEQARSYLRRVAADAVFAEFAKGVLAEGGLS